MPNLPPSRPVFIFFSLRLSNCDIAEAIPFSLVTNTYASIFSSPAKQSTLLLHNIHWPAFQKIQLLSPSCAPKSHSSRKTPSVHGL
ncbi:hypothetical protein SISSUDRAFT_488731 [Sistotremastrum suecicum HHB10207 ss-3]|uniref:Uncharacterized protein n=1 Tax=Sistotremastrum suecicum HHB10207 ss-3 TaxID=1314776 RepID=A0A165Y083_9AGAM|nr:hypothetical protein SISSUDRAFT_488731 [Sistotremastrum suecicum HHB10207 ss-3]